jgi:hypothetical protein
MAFEAFVDRWPGKYRLPCLSSSVSLISCGCVDDLEVACRVSFGISGTSQDIPPVPFRDVKLPPKLKFGYYTSGEAIQQSHSLTR